MHWQDPELHANCGERGFAWFGALGVGPMGSGFVRASGLAPGGGHKGKSARSGMAVLRGAWGRPCLGTLPLKIHCGVKKVRSMPTKSENPKGFGTVLLPPFPRRILTELVWASTPLGTRSCHTLNI